MHLDPHSNEPPIGDDPFAAPGPMTGYRFSERPEDGKDATGGPWTIATSPWQTWLWFVRVLSADPTHHVPPRFGTSAILGITTLLALLFALFRAVDLHPLNYIFSTLLLFTVVLVQMRWGHMARPASIVAGAIWLPLFVLTLIAFVEEPPALLGACCAVPVLVPIGGFFGYLAGTCAGGFFLLMELFEKYWERRMQQSGSTPPAAAPTQLDDPKGHR
ncbi:hypothetical protein [Anatilimnocola floriformis]|uniref:hypothetical protein n=1 Tax=Anatilimnocola floriformis TaxID=2948575 RepID=UPI0020C2C5C6|nr:hypothetical protein [Anatilimnocola floriformis]